LRDAQLVTSPILLLDADIIAFQLAATSQRAYRFPGLASAALAVDDWELQPERIDAAVTKLCEKMKTSRVIVCLSCPTEENWRLNVLPSYKGNRDYSQRPAHLGPVKDYLAEHYPSYRRPTLEADDIMGILSTMKGLPPSLVKEHPQFAEPGKKVIVSEDKDMKTIPGWLWNPAKDPKPRLISEAEADRWHLYQTLVGDTVDGYTGCPGIGPKKADGWLYHSDEYAVPLWARVKAAYVSRGLTEGDALIQARVARICRAEDFDFETKTVRLWQPHLKGST
jgi:hypothetical protein